MAATSNTLQASDRDLAGEQFAASLTIIGSMTVGGMFYGFMTTTAALCAHSLIQTRQFRSQRHLKFLLAYIGLLWMVGTALVASTSGIWVDQYVFQASSSLQDPQAEGSITGGPVLIGNLAYWMILMLSDGMMIWRFAVVWSTSQLYLYLMAAPVVFYLGVSIIPFFAFVIFSNRPVWGSAAGFNEPLVTAMLLSSLCLNLYVTALIAGRLFLYRRRFKANWGSPDTRHYTSMGSILVESYLPLTLGTIIFLVTYLLNNPAQHMMTSVLGQVQITAPLVVMHRVSRGVAWDSSTTPHSVAGAIDRTLEAYELRIVPSVV